MKKIKTTIMILVIILVVAILTIILIYNSKYNLNQYHGEIDLNYIKQAINGREYFIFEDKHQKYLLYKEVVGTYAPSRVENISVKIDKKKYDAENRLILTTTVNYDKILKEAPEGMCVDGFCTDEQYLILKVKDDCSGLIVNGEEYSKFSGAIVNNELKCGYLNIPTKYGYLDSNGNITIPIEYDKIKEFYNSYYDDIKKKDVEFDYSQHFDIYKENSGHGIASTNGKILVNCQYDSISNYGKNSFIVNSKDNKFGIIDINGNVLKKFIDGTCSIKFFREYTCFYQNGLCRCS